MLWLVQPTLLCGFFCSNRVWKGLLVLCMTAETVVLEKVCFLWPKLILSFMKRYFQAETVHSIKQLKLRCLSDHFCDSVHLLVCCRLMILIEATMRCSILFLIYCFVAKTCSESPLGHLKPFGFHKPPTVIVDEFTKENAPHPQEFYENYAKLNKAAVLRGAVVGTRAHQYWTDEYIRENFGDMEVRLEAKHEKKHLPPIGEKYLGRDTLRHFVDNYHNDDSNVYVVSDLPQKMYKDMEVVPSVGACGEMGKNIVEVNIWWSGGGTSSVIHKDAYHQINCLINGTKHWKLIEHKYEKDIYKHPEPEYEIGGFSDINPQEVDLERHPKVANVEWSNITLHAGDCLFLPKSYYHQVVSSGTHNMAVSLLITRFDDRESLDFSDCTKDTDYQSYKSLANFDVQQIWKGHGVMVMGRQDLEDGYRYTFLSYTEKNEIEGGRFDVKTFEEALNDETPGIMIMRNGDVRKAFEIMDKNGDGVFTNAEAKELTLDELRRIADEIEPHEPSNTYEFEYSIITFDNVWTLLTKCLRKFTVLTRERWIRLYKKLGGTEDFANEIFTRLSGGKPDVVSKDVTKEHAFDALENWVKYWAPQYSGLARIPKVDAISDDWELPYTHHAEDEEWESEAEDDEEEESNFEPSDFESDSGRMMDEGGQQNKEEL